jgi:NTE family protein
MRRLKTASERKMPNRTQTRAPRRKARPALDLALQGGGSHGAFTWGVLDRLLAADAFTIDGVSGTSAGALNAAVLATGYARGGASAAREALAAFWRDVATTGACFGAASPASTWMDDLPGLWAEWVWRWPAILSKFASPYQFNPLGINPLRDVAQRHVDVAALRTGPLQVFVTATSVHSGQAEVFSGERLSVDALLASACLPHLFHAVEIDRVPYWDGGYTGNPALWPLIYETAAVDLLLVKINPLERRATPDTPMEIADRVSEITFNAGLTGELRAIAFVQRLIAEDRLKPGRYKNLRMHMVHDEERLAALGPKSKLDTSWDFLQSLHEMGQQAADAWLAQHGSDVGKRASLDIEQTFLRKR